MSQSTVWTATTTLKALQDWSNKTNIDLSEATQVNLEYQSPPIVKIGASLKKLKNCRVLSLACNMIERPTMPNLQNLRILNLSRNNLRTLIGIRFLSSTLEELWVSYNMISVLKPIESMKALKIFYVSHNKIKDWKEIKSLDIPKLKEISFMGNPVQESISEESFRREIAKRLPKLEKLDFIPIIRDGEENKE